MMMRKKMLGISLVEIVVGITIFLLVSSGALIALRSFMKVNIARFNYDHVNEALNYWHGVIRYEAGYRFDTLEETRADRTHNYVVAGSTGPSPFSDGQPHKNEITVYSTISPNIDGTPIRKVKLTGEWMENGAIKTRDMDFTVTYSRTKLAGGLIKMRFVDNAASPHPVRRVIARTLGQDNNTTSAESDSFGYLNIYDVALSTSGVDVELDGSNALYISSSIGVGYYFENNLPVAGGDIVSVPNSGASFKRLIHTVPVMSGPANALNFGTLRIDAPGQFRVKVADVNSPSVPLSGIQVEVAVYENKLKIKNNMPASQSVCITDSEGCYFTSLIPALTNLAGSKAHAFYVIGNSTYAALANVDDDINSSWATAPVHTVVSNPNADASVGIFHQFKTFLTTPRGSVTGTVRALRYEAPNLVYESSINPGPAFRGLKLRNSNNISYDDSPALYNFTNSYAWKFHWHALETGYMDLVINSTGGFSVPFGINKILNNDSATLDQQFNYSQPTFWVTGSSNPVTPNPFLPIMVKQAGDINSASGAKWAVNYLDRDLVPSIWLLPERKTGMEFWKIKFMANSDNYNRFFFMARTGNFFNNSPLGSIHGDLLRPGGAIYYEPLLNAAGSSHSIWMDWRENGGLITFSAGLAATLQYNMAVNTAMISVSSHSYTYVKSDPAVPGSHDYYPLIPNLNNTQSAVIFRGTTGKLPDVTKNYRITLNAWERVKVGTDIFMSTITAPTVITVDAYSTGSGVLWSGPVSFVNVGGNVMQANIPGAGHPHHSRNTYTGTSTVNIKPGVDQKVDITVSTSPTVEHLPMSFVMTGGMWSPDRWNTINFNDDVAADRYEGTWTLTKIGRTGKIYGKVTDLDGKALIGAKVNLWASPADPASNSAPTRSMLTVANAAMAANPACGDSPLGAGYQYVFDDVPFLPSNSDNIKLQLDDASVKALVPGYEGTTVERRDAYDCVTFIVDFKPTNVKIVLPGGI